MSCYLFHFFRISLRAVKAMQIESVARAIDRLNKVWYLPEKNVLRAHLKRNHGKLYINIKLIKYRL